MKKPKYPPRCLSQILNSQHPPHLSLVLSLTILPVSSCAVSSHSVLCDGTAVLSHPLYGSPMSCMNTYGGVVGIGDWSMVWILL